MLIEDVLVIFLSLAKSLTILPLTVRAWRIADISIRSARVLMAIMIVDFLFKVQDKFFVYALSTISISSSLNLYNS
jgi:hypothetical protein